MRTYAKNASSSTSTVPIAVAIAPPQPRAVRIQHALHTLRTEIENLEEGIDQLYGAPSQAPAGAKDAEMIPLVNLLGALPDILESYASRVNNARDRLREGLM
jgi:hypothetical protein